MTSLTASDPYINVPLGQNQNCTRLLTLQSGDFDDMLHCSLQVADFHLETNYEALSYTWGDGRVTSSILLNGTDFQATDSLIVALRHLRLREKDRVLWVDALCINQADEDEKNLQLQRMGQIYTNARVVLVWLGEAVQADIMNQGVEDPTDRAKYVIARTLELSNAGNLTWYTLAPSPEYMLMSYLGCVGPFLESTWFHRLWVIQELALATKVLVTRGRTSLSWDDLAQAMEALQRIPAPSYGIKIIAKYNNNKLAIARFCQNIRHDKENRKVFENASLADRVAALLLLTNGLKATRPKDHLYALLGLIGDREEIAAEPNLVPDSKLSTEDVLKNLTIYLLRERKNLDILYGVSWRNSSLREKLPSWVPSWDGYLSGHLRQYFNPISTLTHSPPNPAKFFLSIDQSVLYVKVFSIGQIESAGIDANDFEDSTHSDHVSYTYALFKSWEENCLMKMLEKRDFTLDEVMPVWLETLFHWDENGDNDLEHALYRILMGHSSSSSLDSSDEDMEGTISMFCRMELNRLHGLGPFVTDNGYIGLPDHRIELISGDWVCLLQGCTIPYILRESDISGSFILVGSCYMWTHMHHTGMDRPVVTPPPEREQWISII